MKPFFCYLGGKWRLAPYYGPPTFDTIIEPFAGAAGYATRYGADRQVILVDKDPVIVGVWDWLIHAKPSDVTRLPLKFDHVDDFKAPQEAKDFIGFWLNKGSTRPAKTPSPRMVKPSWQHRPESHWGPEIQARIAQQVPLIKRWQIRHGNYTASPMHPSTWFIDPPYQVAGTAYKCGSQDIDYEALAKWSRARPGQVIVCENSGAKWLPFKFFRSSKSTHNGGHTVNHEVIWSKP